MLPIPASLVTKERLLMAQARNIIAVIGGTGALGSGLALRLARAGFPIVIGSRLDDKAKTSADDLRAKAGGNADIRGADNAAAAALGEIIILAVPFASHDATCEIIKPGVDGKIVIDASVPLAPPKVARVRIPAGGSAAASAQTILDGARVVSAFQNVAAHMLEDGQEIDCDILVCSDDVEARQSVIDMISAISLRGIHAGPLDNAVVAEALTPVLIGINKRYKVDGAGIRITGLAGPESAGT